MDVKTRERACRALTTARAVGGVFFSRIYVVGNEITFSARAAQVMQNDAYEVERAKYRLQYGAVATEAHFFERVPVESITFEEAFCWIYGTGCVPENIKAVVYKEMDAIVIHERETGAHLCAADNREICARKGFVHRIKEARCLNV